MKVSLITNVHFSDEETLTDLLSSSELTAQETRSELVSRLKRGEGLVAVVDGAAPRAIVLRAAADPSLKGTPDGETLTCLSFA